MSISPVQLLLNIKGLAFFATQCTIASYWWGQLHRGHLTKFLGGPSSIWTALHRPPPHEQKACVEPANHLQLNATRAKYAARAVRPILTTIIYQNGNTVWTSYQVPKIEGWSSFGGLCLCPQPNPGTAPECSPYVPLVCALIHPSNELTRT